MVHVVPIHMVHSCICNIKHSTVSISPYMYPSIFFVHSASSQQITHRLASGPSRGPAGPMAGWQQEGEGEHDGARHAHHPPTHPQFGAAGLMTCVQEER